MTYPNKRDCEHGNHRGKCPECDAAAEIADITVALESAESEARALRCKVAEQEAEVARLREDAERYAWLCSENTWTEAIEAAIDCGSKFVIDAAIDAARNEQP